MRRSSPLEAVTLETCGFRLQAEVSQSLLQEFVRLKPDATLI